MDHEHDGGLLKKALKLDLAISGAATLLLLLGADFLAPYLGMSTEFLRAVGMILVPFVAFVGWAAYRNDGKAWPVWMIIVCNEFWVIASIAVLLGGWLAPTGLGVAFILVQAVAVAGFAMLQFMGIRRRRAAAG